MCPALVALFAWVLPFAPALAAEHPVSSAADVARLTPDLRPGDTLIMANGAWADQAVVFRGKGTAEKPITLRAQTPGQVTLTGKSSLVIEGEHLLVSGLFLQDAQATGEGVKLAGRHCRLTETAIVGGRYKFFVRMFGLSNRLDHCYLADKASDSPTLQVEAEGVPNHHRIDHNHFGPRPPLGRNGGETIRVGYSHQSMSNSATVVEHNLFERCDGELEIISNKSCENIYRFNTFLDCAGMFTLRHGNRCLVEGNFFIGHHKRGSGGIRVIGEDHTVINNYIDGVEEGGFWITAGIPDSPLVGYFQARNCLIAFNTVVDSRGPGARLDAGMGTSRRSLLPENITLANNVLSIRGDGAPFQGAEGNGFKWMGNFTSGSSAAAKQVREGVAQADLKMERAADGLWRPATNSPVRRSAAGSFPNITTDLDGQRRDTPGDAGCDQRSDGPIANRPLRVSDVGPSWRHDRNSSSRETPQRPGSSRESAQSTN
jgi:poly(beta-D-mannuronate) lyase